MPTLRATAARDTVTPALHKAQGTLTGTVVPAVVTSLATARDKGGELLDSDLAHEARRRGFAIVQAARGQSFVSPTRRRWRFGLGMVTIGTAFGFGAAWLARRLQAPMDTYTPSAMPVPSGTDGGNVTPVPSENGAAPSGTPTNEINLSAGARTTF